MDSQYAQGQGIYPMGAQQNVYQPTAPPAVPEAAPTLQDQIKRLDAAIESHHARIDALFQQLQHITGEVQYLRARTGV